jgi:hypothetical protein
MSAINLRRIIQCEESLTTTTTTTTTTTPTILRVLEKMIDNSGSFWESREKKAESAATTTAIAEEFMFAFCLDVLVQATTLVFGAMWSHLLSFACGSICPKTTRARY